MGIADGNAAESRSRRSENGRKLNGWFFFLLQIWALRVNVFPFKFVLLGRDNGHCGRKLNMFFFFSFQGSLTCFFFLVKFVSLWR
jgi:hypothetical protein